MKKTLMIAAAALALTAGAASLQSTPAQAGGNFNLHIGVGGFGGYGPHYGGHGGYGYHGGCYTKWKRVKIKVYNYYGWHWKWIKKPVRVCY